MHRPRLLAWTGVAFAIVYAAIFAAMYALYRQRAGTWFADLPLVMASMPFILPMRALSGGAYDFAGDMTERVVAAGLWCAALAYLAGWIVENAIRALIGLFRGSRR